MTASPDAAGGIPSPLDDDDGDVAWALTTAHVQWNRGSFADAVVWLRRAVDAANEVGQHDRATALDGAATAITERMLSAVAPPAPLPEVGSVASADVDDLLDSVPMNVNIGPPSERSDASPGPPPPETTMLTEYASDSIAAARAEAEAADAAVRNVAVVPPRRKPPPPPRVRVAPPAPNPFLTDDSAISVPASSITSSFDVIVSADLDSDDEDDVTNVDTKVLTTSEPPPSEDVVTSADAQTISASGQGVTAPPPADVVKPEASASSAPPAVVGTVPLDEVRGLQDLPEEAQRQLAQIARVETIDVDQEIGNFAVALVLEGWVSVMPAIDDIAAIVVQAGEVVFTAGSLAHGVEVRVVAGQDETRVAVWDRAAYDAAVADCPWVADDLRAVADRFQACAGAVMGPIGERLDDSLRSAVLGKLEVRALKPGEVLVEAGKPARAMRIVGAGEIEIADAAGNVTSAHGLGEFVFADRVLDHGPAAATARAGPGGALVLVGEGMVTQELLTSVPPLLEILAGA